LGDYYSDRKDFRDSIECYKQVLKLSPDHRKAREKMKSLEIVLKK
jgi:tetratricopeptide (TPR) repeat protein